MDKAIKILDETIEIGNAVEARTTSACDGEASVGVELPESPASKNFEKYVDFWVKVKPSVADKIMFCLYKGMSSPRELMHKLQIAKGNLANYCKQLVADNMITKETSGRVVKYGLAKKGEKRVGQILEAMNDFI